MFYAWLYNNCSGNVEDTEMSKLDRLLYRLEMLKDRLDIDLDYPDDINRYDMMTYIRHLRSGIGGILDEYRGIESGSDKQYRVSRVA